MPSQSAPVLVEEPVEVAVETLDDNQAPDNDQICNSGQNTDDEQTPSDNRTFLDHRMASMAATTSKLTKRLDTVLRWVYVLTLGPIVEAIRMFARYLKQNRLVRHARARGRQVAHVTVVTIPRVVLFFLLCCFGFVEYLAVGSWGLIVAAIAGGIAVVTASVQQYRSDS